MSDLVLVGQPGDSRSGCQVQRQKAGTDSKANIVPYTQDLILRLTREMT